MLIVGGGINGAGIARDLAGRGHSVVLCEKDDLAAHTSSASTKLIHGGLRYLEHYEFSLVRKALAEREVLLRSAPHIMWPLRFVMPHDPGMRPVWMIRAGLFLYDHLARREVLSGSSTIDLRSHPAGAALKPHFEKGFIYSDGWVEDARLVVLNAVDAAARGARVLTRTRCADARRGPERWQVRLEDDRGRSSHVSARVLVNAAGPWAAQFLSECAHAPRARGLRLIKGSHIVVPRVFDHANAYIFQNPDKRIIFAIPYEDEFTLIGTTDVEYTGPIGAARIDETEILYLCEQASRYLAQPVKPSDVVWTYSGVRPLLDDESGDPSAITRDYSLELDTKEAPLLSIWGGKITTFRRLAEEAADLLAAPLGSKRAAWTAGAHLPGGDLSEWIGPPVRPDTDFDRFLQVLARRHPELDPALLKRLARGYGAAISTLLADGLGAEIAPGLYEAEMHYLHTHEWARCADDVLWRRTKLGLHMTEQERARVLAWCDAHWGPMPAAGGSPVAQPHAPHAAPAMQLSLESVEQRVGADVHLHPLTLQLVPNAVTVLLGATQAGKTTLMRLMAGLDHPTRGRIRVDGADVTHTPVRGREVAMVYQQFINYPSMTVFDNIASPLRLRRHGARMDKAGIGARVSELASKLHIEPFLQRLPAELSGGQQQRVALARALAKQAPLMLLDEPLVNLDYKLREELREELSQLFAAGESTVVYATTEPTEALLLGGHTAVLDGGELLQYGPTADVFHRPASIRVARAFSDPPMNLIAGTARDGRVTLAAAGEERSFAVRLPAAHAGAVTLGVRANALRLQGDGSGVPIAGRVELAEISGSDTFVHLDTAHGELVAQLSGVHNLALGDELSLALDPTQVHLFDHDGRLLLAPQRYDGAH